MSYDSKLEGMLTTDVDMSSSNASEETKTVQNEDIKAKKIIKLPRDMRPSKKIFEALGFTFTDIGDRVMYEATLPDGWSIQDNPGSSILRKNLVDGKGRVRGNYYYNGAFYDRYGRMSLFCRYKSTFYNTDSDNIDSPINVVATDENHSIIFNAGQCKEAFSDEYDMLVAKVEEYLKSNYPEWEDVTKYWD